MSFKIIPVLLVSLVALSSATYAQEQVGIPSQPATDIVSAVPMQDGTTVTTAVTPTPVSMTPIEAEINEQITFMKPTVDVNTIPSLFFSIWEHDLIADARRGLVTRAPGTDDGLTAVGPRELALGGIVFKSGKDWTIWLNNTRVSPTAIPDEIMDLKVFKSYIELEWFDATTNQIFPIRLRPHQRFNLDTRIFLPG